MDMSDTTVPNTSQPTSKPGDQAISSQTQLSEQELDRLQLRWILGKNRQENVLSKNELIKLINSGRVSRENYKDIDRDLTQKVGENKKNERSSNDKDGALLVIQGLFVILKQELIDKVGSEIWEGLSKDEQNYALTGYFQYIYGLSWQELEQLITLNLRSHV